MYIYIFLSNLIGIFSNLFIFGCAGSSLLCALSLVAVSGSYALGVVHGLLLVVVSLVVKHGFWGTGSVAVAHGLCCSMACGIFQTKDQTGMPCIGRHVVNHWTIIEVLERSKELNPLVVA